MNIWIVIVILIMIYIIYMSTKLVEQYHNKNKRERGNHHKNRERKYDSGEIRHVDRYRHPRTRYLYGGYDGYGYYYNEYPWYSYLWTPIPVISPIVEEQKVEVEEVEVEV